MQIDQFKLKNSNLIADRAHIDMPLLSAFLVIFLISGIAIYSASNGSINFLIDHATKILISIFAMIIAAQLSPIDYKRIAPWLYFFCVLLLALVLIMGETESVNEARYIHGEFGKGTWTFYGGHDPEDYQHKVGDPKTELELHPNSPGYRLILNNILFPAAKKKKQKT